MTITLGGIDLSEVSDKELEEWFNSNKKGKGLPKIRKDTCQLWINILRIFDECGTPFTIRQMFYQCEVRGFVPKTEGGYRIVDKQLIVMRKSGIIPYTFITDESRYFVKPNTYEGLDSFLQLSKETYRRAIWLNQSSYVQIWLEKRALIGVIDDITKEYDVPLYPCGGYGSLTFIYDAAEVIKQSKKPVYIYYFGDYDARGKDIPRAIQETLSEMGAVCYFKIMAITPEQICRYNLPMRPPKEKDSMSKSWVGDCVELDALPPQVLKDLVRSCIEHHIDKQVLENTRASERLERETLDTISKQLVSSTQFQKGVSSV